MERDGVAEMLQSAADAIWSPTRTAIAREGSLYVAPRVMCVRVARLLRAGSTLVRTGYVPEIASLVRSVWEDAVSAAYMAEMPAERTVQWTTHAEARRTSHIARALQRPNGLTDATLEVLADAELSEPAAGSPYWAGIGPTKMASALGDSIDENARLLSRDFDSMYPSMCDDAHGNPFALDSLLRPDPRGAAVTVGPVDFRLDELPGLMLYGAWQFSCAAARMSVPVDSATLLGLVHEFEIGIGHDVSG